MTVIEVSAQIAIPDLLAAMEKLPTNELDELLQEARALQIRRKEEAELLSLIHWLLPPIQATRLKNLSQKQEEERITEEERRELLELTDMVEQADVERAEALWTLAQQRQLPLRDLLRQLNLERHLG